MFPETFCYSQSSESAFMRQLRKWKRLWRRSLTRLHKRTSMEPSRSCCERCNKCTAAGGDYFEGGLEFHACTINKSAPYEKSLETYLMILVYLSIYLSAWIYIYVCVCVCVWLCPYILIYYIYDLNFTDRK